MNLFLGTTGGNAVTTWTSAALTTGVTSTGAMPVIVDSTAIVDSASGSYTYSYIYSHDSYHTFDSCNSFNWINCDHFYGVGVTTTDVSIALADTSFNAGNTAVYITFPSINSVMNTYSYSFNNFTTSGVPVGMNVGIVVMSYKNGHYYYSYENGITVTASMTRTVTLTEHTFAELTTMLSTL